MYKRQQGVFILVYVILQRGGRERHAVPWLADDEEPGKAGDCQGY